METVASNRRLKLTAVVTITATDKKCGYHCQFLRTADANTWHGGPHDVQYLYYCVLPGREHDDFLENTDPLGFSVSRTEGCLKLESEQSG